MPERTPIAVLGAGPAGLGAAFKLSSRGVFDVTVIERNDSVGGNAGSFELAGLRVDYGSHRLHPACAPEILEDVRRMLGADLLNRPRHGRMLLRGRWVHFPLKPLDLAANLPVSFSAGVARDALAKLGRRPAEDSFEAVLEHGLGRTICRDFYFPYARKIWGVDPAELDGEQARRRVSAGSLAKLVRKVLKAVPGFSTPGAGRFYYPRRGFGQISESYYCSALKQGAKIHLGTQVTRLEAGHGGAVVHFRNGNTEASIAVRRVLSTIPLTALLRAVSPAPPPEVAAAASSLQFRGMILIYLVLGVERFTEFDAHYFPDAGIAITRLSEPKNYGLASLPGRTVLCAELPCSPSDALWRSSDEELGQLVQGSLAAARLPAAAPVLEIATRRLPQAYPIYTRSYREHFDRIDEWVNGLESVVTFGRQGLFAHDNTHHALAMAYALDECLDEQGRLDRDKWRSHRQAFTRHVVED